MEKPQIKKKKRLKKRSKKMIITSVVGGMIIIIGIVIGVHFVRSAMGSEKNVVVQAVGTLETSLTTLSETSTKDVVSEKEKEEEAIKAKLRQNQTDGIKVVFLTFDDGPTQYTGDVLDILKKYNIKATFFTKGNTGDVEEAAFKRIVAEGHTLANHTYSHNYALYKNPSAFYADVKKQENYIKQVTGLTETCHLFRFPGGSLNANKTCVKGILDMGYNYVDWNVSAGDAAAVTPDVQSIVAAVVGGCEKHNVSVVLCHAGLKANTRAALPQIIENLQNEGYTFLPMEDDYTYPRQLTL